MIYVLGIDAGGTKTVCLLADESGEMFAEARRGGANLQAVGELEVEKVLHEVMEEAIGDRDIVPAAICLGIAGVDRADDARVVRGIMRRIGYKARVLVVNDALVALEAGAPGAAGRRGHRRHRFDRLRTQRAARKRRAPAAGATCSATRAAATGSAGRRCARCCARPTAAVRRRC